MTDIVDDLETIKTSQNRIKIILNSWWDTFMFFWVLLYVIPYGIGVTAATPFTSSTILFTMPYFNFWGDLAKVFDINSTIISNKSSDTQLSYFFLISTIVVSAVISLLWSVSLLNCSCRNFHNKIEITLSFIWQNGLRLILAGTFIKYGLMKVIPLQMPVPLPYVLGQQIGDQNGWNYLYNSIGFAPQMEILCGLVELIGGILLLIPRYIILGGYISFMMMTLVVIFVFSYNLPAKVFASCTFIGEFILIFSSLREFYNFFIRKKGIQPLKVTQIIRIRKNWVRNAIIIIYVLFFGLATINQTGYFWDLYQKIQLNPNIPINGRWIVTSEKSINSHLNSTLYTDKWAAISVTALNMDANSIFGVTLTNTARLILLAKYTANQVKLLTLKAKLLPNDLSLDYYLKNEILTFISRNPQTHQPDFIITAKRLPWKYHPGEFQWIYE